jgi:four helix bundle protein
MAVSVASNIAEGAGRMSDREFGRFVRIARGSNQEVLAQLLIAESLGYQRPPKSTRLIEQVERVGAMLSGVLKRLERTA